MIKFYFNKDSFPIECTVSFVSECKYSTLLNHIIINLIKLKNTKLLALLEWKLLTRLRVVVGCSRIACTGRYIREFHSRSLYQRGFIVTGTANRRSNMQWEHRGN